MSPSNEQPKVARYTRMGETAPRTQAAQVGTAVRGTRGATPRGHVLDEMLAITAEYELATARRRMGYVGEATRRGEDVQHFVEEIYEAMAAGMGVTEIADELNCGEGKLRELGDTYGYHTWAVDVLREGQWQEDDAGESVWHRERVAEYAAEVLDETRAHAEWSARTQGQVAGRVPQVHARVRVWRGSNPAHEGQTVHVTYTHEEDATR
ncbi:hypothetical protein [Streptomyces sp. NPDC059008]|uniref:hypothetical protein n=1 Tax=Streptomyces sp. NPDC059008 TaxID=3346693 RepID=UPI0036A7B158